MNRRLYRSRSDTVLGGVAAGLADYLNADPALVRIAWALLVPLTGGAALLAYVVAWIVVPEAPKAAARGPADGVADAADPNAPLPAADETAAGSADAEPRRGDNRAGFVVGLGLILIGVWFLLREYLPDFDWSLVWPVVLIGIGAAILIATMGRRTDA